MLLTLRCVEAVVRHVQESVLPPDAFQYAPGTVQGGTADRGHRRIFQGAPRERGELHQVLVVLVAASAQDCIPLAEVQPAEHPPQQVLRHIPVIDKSQRLSLLPDLQSLGYLLEDTAALVIVYLHLRITGKLEGIGTE